MIRINYNSAYDAGDNRHAQDIMESLGIKYQRGVPESIGDCWLFYGEDDSTIPVDCPAYVEILTDTPPYPPVTRTPVRVPRAAEGA